MEVFQGKNECLFFKSYTSIGQLKDTVLTQWEFPSMNLVFSIQDDHIITQDDYGNMFSLKENSLDSLSLLNENQQIPLLIGFYQISKDSLLLVSKDAGLFHIVNRRLIPFRSKINDILKTKEIRSCLYAEDGILAVGTLGAGIYLIDKDGEMIDHLYDANGLENQNIYFLFLDIQQNLWIGHDNGLSRTSYPVSLKLFDLNNRLRSDI